MSVAIVDCNNFYVSCERVFDPSLIGKPVVVLSNNDGIAIARSNEAKQIGIPMGIPAFKIAGLIRSGKIAAFSSNYTLYGDMSRRVMETLAQFTPNIEIYSIDEAFLDLDGFGKNLTSYCREIMRTVKQWTGMPVSIGAAETKTLAKIAQKIAKESPKTDGVLDLTGSPHIDRALQRVDVGDVWGVGWRYVKFLKARGINTALDLKNQEGGWVRKHLTVMGLRMVHELRGIPSIPMELVSPTKQQICVSRSFGERIETLSAMEEAVAFYASRAGEKLRKDKSAAGGIMVFIMTGRFGKEPQYSNSAIVGLPVASDNTSELIATALKATRSIFRAGYCYQKAGVVLTDLRPSSEVQTDLFTHEKADPSETRRLMSALDKLNSRMGAGTLSYAAEGTRKKWKTKFELRSPRYTTNWEEILRVN